MRSLILVLAIALPLGACGKSGDEGEESQGSAMTANAISSNDITAIDAVTGEAANIAQDVQIDANLLADANGSGNEAAAADRGGRTRRPSADRSRPAPSTNEASPAPEPQANTAQ